jgi:cyclic pyranopterin phosphate synthase
MTQRKPTVSARTRVAVKAAQASLGDEGLPTARRSTRATSPSLPTLTHVDSDGAVMMVDVSAKSATLRHAIARACLRCRPATRDALCAGDLPKGEAIAVAKVAGILAAKKTGELIPLCHPLALDDVAIDIVPVADGVQITATARCTGKTGVEMEAMTAATIAGLALYDMAKAVERDMVLSQVELIEKGGGRSGLWRRTDRPATRPRTKR